MTSIFKRIRIAFPLLVALLPVGCAVQKISPPVALLDGGADAGLVESQLLDVAINLFTPVLEMSTTGDDALQSLRVAEAYYSSWHLAQTLQQSSLWGAIRVNPFALNTADLMINGTLLQSDGETLRLRISAVDSTGRVWLNKEYYQLVDASAYAAPVGDTPPFPFHSLYNHIANDVAQFRQKILDADDLEELRKISALRFAADFAPDIYGVYLVDDGRGRLAVDRMPPFNDPAYSQISTIRDRNSLFLDALQPQYATFVARVDDSYRNFLARSQRITAGVNDYVIEEREEQRYGTAQLLNVGIVALNVTPTRIDFRNRRSNSLNTGSNALIYAAALARAGSSFELEVQPQTLEFSAHSVVLTGTLEQQFEQWRSTLLQLHMLDEAR